MKNPIYDQAGSGLLVLIMLTIAFIASQAEAGFRERAAATDAPQADAGLHVSINGERLARLESISWLFESVLDLPVTMEFRIEQSEIPAAENSEPNNATVQIE